MFLWLLSWIGLAGQVAFAVFSLGMLYASCISTNDPAILKKDPCIKLCEAPLSPPGDLREDQGI